MWPFFEAPSKEHSARSFEPRGSTSGVHGPRNHKTYAYVEPQSACYVGLGILVLNSTELFPGLFAAPESRTLGMIPSVLGLSDGTRVRN